MDRAPKEKRSKAIRYLVLYAALAVSLLIAMFPVYWIVSTSLKPMQDWLAWPPVWLPSKLEVFNYLILFAPKMFDPTGAFARNPVTPSIINSLIIAGASTITALVVGYLAAYAISRYGTGGNFMYFFVLLTRMTPPIAMAIPLLVFLSFLGLVDTHLGLILMYSTFTVAYVIWMMKSFIDEIPRDIEMAAMLDGYSDWAVIFKVTLPLVKGGLAASGLFTFILNWSEFLLAFTFTHTKAVTIPFQIATLSSAVSGMMYGPISAFSIIAVIPMMVVGYAIQNYLTRGLTFGAVRGR